MSKLLWQCVQMNQMLLLGWIRNWKKRRKNGIVVAREHWESQVGSPDYYGNDAGSGMDSAGPVRLPDLVTDSLTMTGNQMGGPVIPVQTGAVSPDTGRCLVIADEGTAVARQCVLPAHEENPDAHEFVAGSLTVSVDGGRNWRDWIVMVTRARAIMLPEREQIDNGLPAAVGNVDQWSVVECRAILGGVAEALGLYVKYEEDFDPEIGAIVKFSERKM